MMIMQLLPVVVRSTYYCYRNVSSLVPHLSTEFDLSKYKGKSLYYHVGYTTVRKYQNGITNKTQTLQAL